ncbi:type IVa pilus major pilin TapA [Aeromonas piscicola]|uniref:Type IVa pilus major pilin TapA n=1 Tax=Aeromonas piscicola TaxID=600645 RepID=A0ABT7QF57_9GAMM|nr:MULTISPECIES: type IVa pilus major pilin TapA [Aeromonas]MCX7133574.1 type IVa pilus major pilin TapA [Aeromonas sp.]MDM5132458.1 type IVa pilus major pilin TapA [Aeromonas piscicola]
MKKQSGFTLIELMIVVAIVAILAAIALPAYQTYTQKAKFTEVVSATGAFKTAIEVCYQTGGDMSLCDQNSGGGVPSAAGASGFVSSVTVGAGAASAARITATGVAPVAFTYILDGSGNNGQVTWAVVSSSTCIAAGVC